MTIHTIDDTILHGGSAEAYFRGGDRRIMIGMRTALELLKLPTPEYCLRRLPGKVSKAGVALAYAADNLAPRSTTLAPRKANATPERIAALNGQSTPKASALPAVSLFDQAFSG